MKKFQILGLMLVILLISSCGKGGSSDKVKLQLKLEKGKTYEYLVAMQQAITTEFQGKEQKMQQSMQFGYNFKVEDISTDSITTLSCTYTSVKFDMDMVGNSSHYDSKDSGSSDDIMSKVMGGFVNKSFKMKISPQMRVLEISGMSEIISSFFDSVDVPEFTKNTIKEQFSKQYGDEAIKESFQTSFMMFPDKPVGVGDSWNETIELTKSFPIKINISYTVKERKDGKMTIALKSEIETNKETSKTDIGNAQMEYKMSGTQDGSIVVDEATGWIVNSKINQKINGTMVITGEGQTLETPLNIDGTITVESK